MVEHPCAVGVAVGDDTAAVVQVGLSRRTPVLAVLTLHRAADDDGRWQARLAAAVGVLSGGAVAAGIPARLGVACPVLTLTVDVPAGGLHEQARLRARHAARHERAGGRPLTEDRPPPAGPPMIGPPPAAVPTGRRLAFGQCAGGHPAEQVAELTDGSWWCDVCRPAPEEVAS